MVGLQGAQCVQAHLWVGLGAHLDTHAVLEVHDDQLGAARHDHVGGAPGLVLRGAEVGGVVHPDVGEHDPVVTAQVGDVVHADLDVACHVLVDREPEAVGLDQAADERSGGQGLLQCPGQHLVRGGALGCVAAGAVGQASLQDVAARAQHSLFKPGRRPLRVCELSHDHAASAVLTAARASAHLDWSSSLNVFTPKLAATAAALSRDLPARANTAFCRVG